MPELPFETGEDIAREDAERFLAGIGVPADQIKAGLDRAEEAGWPPTAARENEDPAMGLRLTAEGWRITEHARPHNGDGRSDPGAKLADTCRQFRKALSLIQHHVQQVHGAPSWTEVPCTRLQVVEAAAAFLSDYLSAEFRR